MDPLQKASPQASSAQWILHSRYTLRTVLPSIYPDTWLSSCDEFPMTASVITSRLHR